MVSKLDIFIIVTILFFSDVYMNGVNGNWVPIICFTLMYIVFILISLYEIGKIEIEKEENENRNNREQDV